MNNKEDIETENLNAPEAKTAGEEPEHPKRVKITARAMAALAEKDDYPTETLVQCCALAIANGARELLYHFEEHPLTSYNAPKLIKALAQINFEIHRAIVNCREFGLDDAEFEDEPFTDIYSAKDIVLGPGLPTQYLRKSPHGNGQKFHMTSLAKDLADLANRLERGFRYYERREYLRALCEWKHGYEKEWSFLLENVIVALEMFRFHDYDK